MRGEITFTSSPLGPGPSLSSSREVEMRKEEENFQFSSALMKEKNFASTFFGEKKAEKPGTGSGFRFSFHPWHFKIASGSCTRLKLKTPRRRS